uniref:Uncharacterized protein n=2 Tax=Talaromyces marneffei TaxID=37727 RepID=A0A093Y777_TALMA
MTLAPVTWAICLILTICSVSLVVFRLFMNIRNLDMADYFMAMGGVMTITYTGLMISLSRYNRHQRDSPACWMDGHYLRVKPHPPQENIYLLHVPQNLSQDVNENRSKLMRSSDRNESYEMTPNAPGGSDNQDPRKPHTWKYPQADEYYELTDSNFMQTQVTTVDQEDPSVQNFGVEGASRNGMNIVRTVNITQQAKSGNQAHSPEQLF